MLHLQEWNKSDFHIVEEIFRSNTGAVYKARVRRSGEIVVLKERRAPELGRGRGVMEHEVELLEKVKHPNVIRCYGHFRDNSTTSRTGSFYMVLEYASGGDLYKQILKRRKEKNYFSENAILKIFRQICQGLCALHEMGIIHRDIKTLNILLDKPKSSESVNRLGGSKSGDDSGDAFSVEGQEPIPSVKIGDLGVGRELSIETVMVNTFYGTPLYASPELCENKPYNELTDIWSLGVVLYELAALEHPFSGKNLMALANAISKGKYDPIPVQYSKFLVDLIAALLNKNQSQRPRIREILGWLDNAMEKNDSPRQKESASPRHHNTNSIRHDNSESSTEDEQGNTRARGRHRKKNTEDDRRKKYKGSNSRKVGSSRKTNSRAGSTMGERPPTINFDDHRYGDKRKNRYKERPKTAHSRKSNSGISRAGSVMGDKPPPSQDNRPRPSSSYSTSSQKYSKLKERSRQYQDPLAQEEKQNYKRDRNVHNAGDKRSTGRNEGNTQRLREESHSRGAKSPRGEVAQRRHRQQKQEDEEDWIARHHRKLEEARRKNEIRRSDRYSLRSDSSDKKSSSALSKIGEKEHARPGKRRGLSSNEDRSAYEKEVMKRKERQYQRQNDRYENKSRQKEENESRARRHRKYTESSYTDDGSFSSDDDDDEKNSIVSSTPSYRARIQDWERRREEAERQSNASTSMSSLSQDKNDSNNSRMRASSRNSGHGSLSSSLVPRERYNEVEPNRMNRYFLDDPVPHTRRGYGNDRYRNNRQSRKDTGRRNIDRRTGDIDNRTYDKGTEKSEDAIHDQSSRKVSHSRDTSEGKSHEDENKVIARRSKPKVEEMGGRRRSIKTFEKGFISDVAAKESSRNRRYDEDQEHENHQDKDKDNRGRRSGSTVESSATEVRPKKVPTKATDRRPSSRGSIGSRASASSRLSTVSGTPQRQARYFENEIRRQQTHLRRLYAAAEWIRTSGNKSERVEIEAQIHDVEYYIEDLKDQLDDLKIQSRKAQSLRDSSDDDSNDSFSQERPRRRGKMGKRSLSPGSARSRPSSRHSFQNYISNGQ